MRTLTLAATVTCVLTLTAASAVWAAPARTAAYMAPPGTCPGGESTATAIPTQYRALVCLVNWARRQARLGAVKPSVTLSRAATAKGLDVVRCNDFSHTACGKPPTAAVRGSGYRYSSWGENLFLGTDELGTARMAVQSWLQSPPHRRTLLARDFAHVGIALLRPESLAGSPGVSLWVLQLARPR
jgi:uncharacterized protein YkwD